jgi:hypothetical protein
MSTVDEILHAAEESDDEEATFSKMKLEDILNSKDDELLQPVARAVSSDTGVCVNANPDYSSVETTRYDEVYGTRNSSVDARELNDILGEEEEEDAASTLDKILAESEENLIAKNNRETNDRKDYLDTVSFQKSTCL